MPRRSSSAPSRPLTSRTRRETARSSRCWRGSITSPARISFRARAQEVLAAFAGEAQRNLFGLATLLNGAELLERALQVVVVGAREAPETQALLRTISQACLPTRVLSVVAGAAELPESHPAAGKGMVGGRTTVYLCEGTVCSLPLCDPAALQAALAAR